MKGFFKWHDTLSVHLAVVAIGVLLAGLLLVGCVGRVEFAGQGAVCKPSELRLCNPEPLIPQ